MRENCPMRCKFFKFDDVEDDEEMVQGFECSNFAADLF